MTVCDPSEFAPDLTITGHDIGGHRVLRAQSATVPNAIAAFLLYIRKRSGQVPHVYFQWTEGSPIAHLARYVFFGEGDIAPVTTSICAGRRAKRPTGGRSSTSPDPFLLARVTSPASGDQIPAASYLAQNRSESLVQ